MSYIVLRFFFSNVIVLYGYPGYNALLAVCSHACYCLKARMLFLTVLVFVSDLEERRGLLSQHKVITGKAKKFFN